MSNLHSAVKPRACSPRVASNRIQLIKIIRIIASEDFRAEVPERADEVADKILRESFRAYLLIKLSRGKAFSKLRKLRDDSPFAWLANLGPTNV